VQFNSNPFYGSSPHRGASLASLPHWEIVRFRCATAKTHEQVNSTRASVRRIEAPEVFATECANGSSNEQGYGKWSALVSLTTNQMKNVKCPFANRRDSGSMLHLYQTHLVRSPSCQPYAPCCNCRSQICRFRPQGQKTCSRNHCPRNCSRQSRSRRRHLHQCHRYQVRFVNFDRIAPVTLTCDRR